MQNFNVAYTQMERESPDEVKNNAGGYVYEATNRMRRFLVLGSDSGTYYVSRKDTLKDNISFLRAELKRDPVGYVSECLKVNSFNLAPKVDPALFALALASVEGEKETRAAVLHNLLVFCRTGTHLFNFLEYRKQLGGGWGSLVRKAVKAWYARDPEQVGYQVAKYRQRDGWSHRDVMRLAHPKAETEQEDAVNLFAVTGEVVPSAPEILQVYKEVANAKSAAEVCALIDKYGKKVAREFIPTQFLTDPMVWKKMIKEMPLMAMTRNLRNIHKYGAMDAGTARTVIRKLSDEDAIRKSRMHPVHFLLALGATEGLSDMVRGALEGAFYASFGNVESTGKRICIGLDLSGSMYFGGVAGTALTPAQAALAMAMVTVNTETCDVFGFGSTYQRLSDIRPGANLSALVRKYRNFSFGATDCALPMIEAGKAGKQYDAFIIYTDNETWSGRVKPMTALRSYRKNWGVPDAKLIVVGMTSTGFSIADPRDPGTLDVVGFDASVPQVISQTIA